MCHLTNQIKFCTCKAQSTERLKNYWVLHRFDKDRFDGVMGMCNPPLVMDEAMVAQNEQTLLQRVNEPDAFDMDLQPQAKDRLEIVLTCREHFGGALHIGFEYKKGRWVPCAYDLFEWTWKHTEDLIGKLKWIEMKSEIAPMQLEQTSDYKSCMIESTNTDWVEVNLFDNCTLKARIGWQGLTTAEYLESGDYGLVTGTDLKDGFIDWEGCVYVEKVRYDQDKNIQLKINDVLVTKDGTIGKVAFVDQLSIPTTLNSGVFVIRPKNERVDNRFLYYILMSFYFKNFLSKITAGSTITHLYQKDFVTFNFPLPSLPEQTAIAQALSDADALIAGLEKLIEKKKKIKQGAMQELLRPKEGWVNVAIKDIAKVGRGRVISHNEISKSIEGRYPVYSSQTANDGVMGYIDSFDFQGEYITWTTDGEKAGTVFYRKGKFNCTNVCGTIKLNNGHAKFLSYVLAIEAPKHVSRNLANPKLMNEPMKNVRITMPINITEQEAIANTISNFEKEINMLEGKYEKLLNQKQGMMQNLLSGKIRLV